MTKKSAITVRRAVEEVFRTLPVTFQAIIFCERVRAKTGRQFLMDGTILRRLREARADQSEYNYRCIDTELAVYQKMQPCELNKSFNLG